MKPPKQVDAVLETVAWAGLLGTLAMFVPPLFVWSFYPTPGVALACYGGAAFLVLAWRSCP